MLRINARSFSQKNANLSRQFLLNSTAFFIAISAGSTGVFAAELNNSNSATDLGEPMTLSCETRLEYYQPEECPTGGEKPRLQLPQEPIRPNPNLEMPCVLTLPTSETDWQEVRSVCVRVPL